MREENTIEHKQALSPLDRLPIYESVAEASESETVTETANYDKGDE